MNNPNDSSEIILHSSENEETSLFDQTAAHDAGKLKAAEENVTVDWNVGDVILDLYEVTDILGKGGMGKVYKVHHKNWKIDLAVKTPLPEIVATETGKENFIREAETWVNLGLHPHLVSCYYVRTLGNIPRVFAEYVEGGSLKDWINNGKLYEGGKERSLEGILDISIQFAWGLDYAHEQGLIHQDIKPGNVLISNDGITKVTDFGLARARAIPGEKYGSKLGESIAIQGIGFMTEAYCSPEQAAGQPLTRKTDIWSWGLSILEMFIGERWWEFGVAAEENLNIYIEQGSEDPDIPKMPDSLLGILRKCFKKEPQERPANMTEIVNILKEIYKEETKKEYPKKDPRSLDLRADGLNNKAISLLDLGREEEAVNSWQEALKVDPQHLYTNFNYGYYRWQNAEITDDVLATQMEGIENVHRNNPDYWLCFGWIHYERGDVDAIDKIQQSEYCIKDEKFKKALEDPDRPIVRELRRFEGHTKSVNSVCFSPDGRYALSGSDDQTIRLWDIETGKEIRRFEGYSYSASSVCFSPDGLYALSDSGTESGLREDCTIRLWEILSGREIKKFVGHFNTVASVSFSPDGRYVLSGSGDIRLWEVSSGKEIKKFEDHTRGISSVCFSQDGNYILSGGYDNTIRIWEIASGKEIQRFKGHSACVTSVCFSNDGLFVLSGSEDKTIRLWDTKSAKEIKRFNGHTGCINSINFSPNGYFVISGSGGLYTQGDKTIRLWDTKNGREKRRIDGHKGTVKSVCFSPDNRYVLSGSSDTTIRFWKISFHKVSLEQYHPYPILSKIRDIFELINEKEKIDQFINLAKDYLNKREYEKAFHLIKEIQILSEYEREKEVLDLKSICYKNGKFKRISLINSWCVYTINGHSGSVSTIGFSPSGLYAVSGSMDETIRIWEISSGREIKKFVGHFNTVTSVSFSPDGCYVLSGSRDIRLWEISSGKEIRRFKGNTYYYVTSVSFSPDGCFILSGSQDKTIRLWEISSGREIRRFEGHSESVVSVNFSPDGLFAISASDDKTIRLWEISTGREIRMFEGTRDKRKSVWNPELLFYVCFSPDGCYALSGSKDIRLWEVSSGREIKIFKGHTNSIISLCFSPDGQYAISGSFDKTIRLWELSTGREIKRFDEHTDNIRSICFSPDGRYALSGSDDKTIRLWEFDWEWEFPEEEQ